MRERENFSIIKRWTKKSIPSSVIDPARCLSSVIMSDIISAFISCFLPLLFSLSIYACACVCHSVVIDVGKNGILAFATVVTFALILLLLLLSFLFRFDLSFSSSRYVKLFGALTPEQKKNYDRQAILCNSFAIIYQLSNIISELKKHCERE